MSDMSTTIYQLFQMYHRQLGFGVIAALLAVLRHIHDGKTVRVYAFDATVCMFIGAGADQILELFNMPAKWGYLTAIFIGVFGWRVVVEIFKSKVPNVSIQPKKPE